MTDLSTNNSKGLLPQISIGTVVVIFLLQVSGFRHAAADTQPHDALSHTASLGHVSDVTMDCLAERVLTRPSVV